MIKLFVRVLTRVLLLWTGRGRVIDIHPSARVGLRAFLGPLPSVLRIGEGSIISARMCGDRVGAEILIGSHTFIGRSNLVAADSIVIGDDVLISWGCQIVDHDSHAIKWVDRAHDVRDWYEGRKDWSKVPRAKVQIGNKVWLGFNVVVVKGVTIGEGAVVAAGSVVTRDVSPFTLVAGVPARKIRDLHDAA